MVSVLSASVGSRCVRGTQKTRPADTVHFTKMQTACQRGMCDFTACLRYPLIPDASGSISRISSAVFVSKSIAVRMMSVFRITPLTK